ncbi:hypothetical protein J5N97_023052 [Dioscorea zingiberensis]|uniref:Uncharacterized protein n=1 Tax=Dioscorea zingiberensis TaxID=325984 RepID=A0A9D5CCF7_9LILI|nr:hypothetical protein J5N97_023052 [Dioscorea zingiberensis]
MVESNEAQPKGFKEMPPEGSLSSPNMPSYLLIHNAEAPENLMEKSDRPSPCRFLSHSSQKMPSALRAHHLNMIHMCNHNNIIVKNMVRVHQSCD